LLSLLLEQVCNQQQQNQSTNTSVEENQHV
jgi:hypothetical protein